jgi:DnaJ homolog subfamily B member 13
MIRVKPGWRKGTKVTLEGMGDERPGCLPGDAVFVVSERRHKRFKRLGDDLVLRARVPLVSALTGWSVSFRLLSGEKLHCSFRDEVICPGHVKVVRARACRSPAARRAARAGTSGSSSTSCSPRTSPTTRGRGSPTSSEDAPEASDHHPTTEDA